jgi:hypothetical protein
MPALVAGIHVFGAGQKIVDGRDKPGHDDQQLVIKAITWRRVTDGN